jgi:SAM-dependent methyltransferase
LRDDTAGSGHDHHGESRWDVVMDEASLNERYRSSSALWSGNPTPHLVTEAADLDPGAALDVGCGEGADAIWLAERGWRVTAVDLSTVALERAAAHALEVGVDVARRIDWLHADLTDWMPEMATYDLVSAQFMHLPKEPREALFRRLAASVSSGGTLLIVGHHPSDMQTTIARPPAPGLFFTAADVAATLDPHEWDIIVSDTRARPTLDSEGRTVTIHDAVLRARRGRLAGFGMPNS